MKKSYDVVYSIGRDCACASYLKEFNLRACSGPFDWLTNAGFEKRFELILNGFEYFLDKQYLVQMEKPTMFPSDKNNDYYENTKTELYFYHDFPADTSFSDAYPSIKEKYERRIARFYNNIKTGKRVLLVWLSHITDLPQEDVIVRLCNELSNKMQSSSIDFLIIEHEENLQTTIIKKLADNISLYKLHTRAIDVNGFPAVQGDKVRVSPIFMQYKLTDSTPVRIKVLTSKILAKFLCAFIPLKRYRRKVRDYFIE